MTERTFATAGLRPCSWLSELSAMTVHHVAMNCDALRMLIDNAGNDLVVLATAECKNRIVYC